MGFIHQQPVLLDEVLSPSTRTFDTVDKFIAYRTIPSLEFYLLVEPDFCHVALNYKIAEGEWMAEVFNKITDDIKLAKLKYSTAFVRYYFGLDWG